MSALRKDEFVLVITRKKRGHCGNSSIATASQPPEAISQEHRPSATTSQPSSLTSFESPLPVLPPLLSSPLPLLSIADFSVRHSCYPLNHRIPSWYSLLFNQSHSCPLIIFKWLNNNRIQPSVVLSSPLLYP